MKAGKQRFSEDFLVRIEMEGIYENFSESLPKTPYSHNNSKRMLSNLNSKNPCSLLKIWAIYKV